MHFTPISSVSEFDRDEKMSPIDDIEADVKDHSRLYLIFWSDDDGSQHRFKFINGNGLISSFYFITEFLIAQVTMNGISTYRFMS